MGGPSYKKPADVYSFLMVAWEVFSGEVPFVKKMESGLLVFIIIFIIIIPLLLFKNQMYSILEAYMPNLDIIATVITWHGGPSHMWDHLYPPSPLSIYGFSSQTLINYVALLGLTYIITCETKRSGSMMKGWSIAFIMLLMTYLLPGQFISWTMDKTKTFVSSNIKLNFIDTRTIVVIMGILISTIIIVSEAFILIHFKTNIETVAHNILKVPKLFKKLV